MNENELYVVNEYKFDNPRITKIDSIIDSCYRDCHKKYFLMFKYVCLYNIKLTKITINEIINITNSVESMNLFELNKKLILARQRGFRFLQINKLTIKILFTSTIYKHNLLSKTSYTNNASSIF